VYYEDHRDFNEEFDRDYEIIRLGKLELLPSRVLYHADHEAYKAALNEFIAERNGTNGNGNTNPQEEAG
jgi:hypothetical protein